MTHCARVVSRSWWMLLGLGCAKAPAQVPRVRPGIDVLVEDSLRLLAGRRVGVLTNQTGVDRTGTSDVERLLEAGVQLTAIFSPEHGYRGVLNEDNIGNAVDSATGTPLFSLYGATRAPTAAMLANVDVLVIDLQDIGARPYTYISTVLLAMDAARQHGVAVVVADRPDPIGGEAVQGPVLDTAYASFVGMLPVPLRHGMTLGELARMGNDVLGFDAQLTVVPVAGWQRGAWFDATGLPWVRPSPSMPSLESAVHYPGTVLFEGTNLSVGRGTPVAFQVFGAPWLNAAELARQLEGAPGVRVTDTTITPRDPPDGKYGGVTFPAVRLRVSDRAAYDPVALAVRALVALRGQHPGAFSFRPASFDRLAGGLRLREAIEAGTAAPVIVQSWQADLKRFRQSRERYLLYRP